MAFDRIDPPDLWISTATRLLYALYCSWATRPRPFRDFLPDRPREPMSDAAMRAALHSIPVTPCPTSAS